MHKLAMSIIAVLLLATLAAGSGASDPAPVRTLDGSGNNPGHAGWGQAGTQYSRVGAPNYADGIGADGGRAAQPLRQQPDLQRRRPEHVLGERRLAVGLGLGPVPRPRLRAARRDAGRDRADRVRRRRSAGGVPRTTSASIDFSRTPAAPGPGSRTRGSRSTRSPASSTARGSTAAPTRGSTGCATGPVDGNPANNGAHLLLPGGYLPRADARGNAAAAPGDGPDGPARPPRRSRAVVAGDVRANENIALTAIHTLFAREHNRIVARCCPPPLSAEAGVPDRPPHRRRRDPVHHVQRVPARPRRRARPVPRVRPEREPGLRTSSPRSATARTA